MTEERVIVEIPITLYNEIKKKCTDPPSKVLETIAKKYLKKIQG